MGFSRRGTAVYVASLLVYSFFFASAQANPVSRKLAGTSLAGCLATGKARTAFPGSQAYTNARTVFNLRNKYMPAAFVFPTTIAQVQNAIQCSIQLNIGIAPRGGGHSYEDYSLGGRDGVLVVDMTGFTSIRYNQAAQTATVGSGWRLGPLYLALWNLGKVTVPGGTCVSVGLGGHALGGGWGYVSRKFGLVTDNIVEAQLVTANGTIVTANANQNADLYFALRGAGANSYGIVTQFTLKVHEVSSPVTHFKYNFNVKSQQAQVLKAFQIWGLTAISQVSASLYLDPSGGTNLGGVYLGPSTGLAAVTHNFLANAPTPATTDITQTDFIKSVLYNGGFSETADPSVLNLKSYTLPTTVFKAKSIFVQEPGLSDAGISALVNALQAGPADSYFIFDLYGSLSVINQVAPSATAFVHRSSLYSIQMFTYWGNNPSESNSDTTFIDNFWNTVRPYATAEAYQNYIDKDMPLSAYYGSNLNTLIADKKKWDPKNIFNFPQSIPLS